MSNTTDGNDPVEFFWRPGCPFCMRLEDALNKANITFDKFNIWDDPQHAAFVRSVADGNEVVPTVRIGNVSMVNPSLDQVVGAMGS